MGAPAPDGMLFRLQQARDRRGYSHRGAARKMGCGYQWLGKIERGEKSLSLAWAVKMAALYDVSLDWLILGRDPT